jgi:hypothetical protein
VHVYHAVAGYFRIRKVSKPPTHGWGGYKISSDRSLCIIHWCFPYGRIIRENMYCIVVLSVNREKSEMPLNTTVPLLLWSAVIPSAGLSSRNTVR